MKTHEMRAQETGWAPKSTLVLCFSCWRRLLCKSLWHSLTSFLSHPRRIVADMDGLINPYCTCSYSNNWTCHISQGTTCKTYKDTVSWCRFILMLMHWPYSASSTWTMNILFFLRKQAHAASYYLHSRELGNYYSPNHCPCTGWRRAPMPAPTEAKTKEKQLLMVMP